MSSVRRSQRILDRSSSQPVTYDDSIEESDYSDAYEEEEEPPKETKRRKINNKKPKVSKKSNEEFLRLTETFENHYLFDALKFEEVSISELAQDWIDDYKVRPNGAKQDLVNLILNLVGCYTKIEEHDVVNNDSANETVGEIQTFFNKQQLHENYIVSKKHEYKFLRVNYVQFVSQIIEISEENGLLYRGVSIEQEEGEEEEEEDEEEVDSVLIDDLFVWLISFTVSSIRALRYISTISLYEIETTLCQIIARKNELIKSFKDQLAAEEKKSRRLQSKIEAIQSNLSSANKQASKLESFIQNILNTTFLHRFKDVDPAIRFESMKSLGDWFDYYPEFFFQVNYLKYFGWVLSDQSAAIRVQVVKSLIKIVKKKIIVNGLTLFFNRFKPRLIEMCELDVDNNVRVHTLQLLVEITGYLEEEEVLSITKLLFNKSFRNNAKFNLVLSKFLNKIEARKTGSKSSLIKEFEDDFDDIELKQCFTVNSLLEMLSPFDTEIEDQVESHPLATIFRNGNYDSDIVFLIEYFNYEFDSNLDEELLENLEIKDKTSSYCLLNLILASLAYLRDEDKKKSSKNNSTLKHVFALLPKLNQTLKNKHSSNKYYKVFLRIFTLFSVEVYEEHNEIDVYKTIYDDVLASFENSYSIEGLEDEYTEILKTLNKSNNFIDKEIVSNFREIVTKLVLKLKSSLESDDFSDIQLDEEVLVVNLNQQYFNKLLLLGKYLEIDEFLSIWKLFSRKIVSNLTDFNLAQINLRNSKEIVKCLNVCLCGLSWRLNYLLKTNSIINIEDSLSFLPDYLQELMQLAGDVKSGDLRFEIMINLNTLLIILKNFYLNYKQSRKTNLENFNRFFDIDVDGLKMPAKYSEMLLRMFLEKESIFANGCAEEDIQLDREEDEDVNLNSVRASDADLQLGLSEEELQFENEKMLFLFAHKLLGLQEAGLLDERVYERLLLNRAKLGELYNSLFGGAQVGVQSGHQAGHKAEPQAESQAESQADSQAEEVPEIAMQD